MTLWDFGQFVICTDIRQCDILPWFLQYLDNLLFLEILDYLCLTYFNYRFRTIWDSQILDRLGFLPSPPAQMTFPPTTPMAKSPRLVGMLVPIFHCAERSKMIMKTNLCEWKTYLIIWMNTNIIMHSYELEFYSKYLRQ